MFNNKGLNFGAIFLLCLLSLPARALIINKYELPDKIAVEDSEMVLQGAAIRTWYMMVKGYIGALYLEEPSSDPEEIFASESYQRMSFVMLVSKMSARRIAHVFSDSIQLNTQPEDQLAYQKELDQIFSIVSGSMKRGEEAIFEYLPGKGVRIEIAGVDKGIIPANKELFNLFCGSGLVIPPQTNALRKKCLALIRLAEKMFHLSVGSLLS